MLKNNNYLTIYRSVFNDFDNDFLNPSYKESIQLDRGSGYFSLKSLILSFDGLLSFIKNGGFIRLICNPELSVSDIDAISQGILFDEYMATNDLMRILNSEKIPDSDIDKMDVITNLIACGRLQIKVAYMPNGIYHEKFGIFRDKNGDSVYFNGSANETISAKKNNFESFYVVKSWENELSKLSIDEESIYFEKLWNNELKDDSINVYSFPEALLSKIFTEYKITSSLEESIRNYEEKKKVKTKTLYPFQEKAIQEFIANGYKHFYEMATGTGKTFTSVKTIQRVLNLEGKTLVMICVPQIDLQTQWFNALSECGFEDIIMFGGDADSKTTDDNIVSMLINWFQNDDSIICISIYDTFFSKIYDKLDSIDHLFVIFDEAHNLNFNQISKLPSNAKMKLGLSATLERFNQDEEKLIVNYFTEGLSKPFYYGIEEAIENKFLSKYEYYPIYVRLSFEDYEKYEAKTKAIGKLIALKNEKEDIQIDEQINHLRNERSLILKQSPAKIDMLDEMINGPYDFHNSVVYCGQGKDEDELIINKVTEKLYRGGYSVSQFTSKTKDRKKVLYEFENNFYDTLIAIKCFDEGVDVPKLDKIYVMASDASLRQTVQRRGRVLRQCKETGKNMAYIYDMIVLPPIGVYDVSHAMIISEFGRAYEYARLAVNLEMIQKRMDDYLEEYGVLKEELSDE